MYRRVGHGRFLLGSRTAVNLPPPPDKTAKTDGKGGDGKAQAPDSTATRYFAHRLKHRKVGTVGTSSGEKT